MWYSAAHKTAAIIVKQSKEKSEDFGQELDTDYRLGNKVFGQTMHCLHGKQTPIATFIKETNSVLLKHQKGILNHWREYFCQVLNPVTAQHFKTFNEQFCEKVYLIKAKVSTAIKSLKAGKTPGEDDI